LLFVLSQAKESFVPLFAVLNITDDNSAEQGEVPPTN
jgi:hypothetical protein